MGQNHETDIMFFIVKLKVIFRSHTFCLQARAKCTNLSSAETADAGY